MIGGSASWFCRITANFFLSTGAGPEVHSDLPSSCEQACVDIAELPLL